MSINTPLPSNFQVFKYIMNGLHLYSQYHGTPWCVTIGLTFTHSIKHSHTNYCSYSNITRKLAYLVQPGSTAKAGPSHLISGKADVLRRILKKKDTTDYKL